MGNPGNPLKNEEIVVVDEWCFFVEVGVESWIYYIFFLSVAVYIYWYTIGNMNRKKFYLCLKVLKQQGNTIQWTVMRNLQHIYMALEMKW